MFTTLKSIQDKYPFFYRTDTKKNDHIINANMDTNTYVDADADLDTNTHELQCLLERCDTEPESHTPNYAKNILYKIGSFFTKIKPTLVSIMSKSYFITSCISIYIKYYVLYKCSKKTTTDYNNIIIRLSEELANKNIFFTKILQGISNNVNNTLMNKELCKYFISYTDNVKYDVNEIDYNGLLELISIAKSKGDELVIYGNNSDNGGNNEPMKSGIIAIVYKATLNGKQVIIKYRRKNIVNKFDKSMKELELLVNIINKMPYLSDINICDIFEENREIMTEQLNFANEVDNIQVFYNKFKHVQNICIPHVYSYFTEANSNAIIMDYIEGIRLENVDVNDRDEYSKILSRFNIKSAFYDSLYHADLHPGNIIFMKEPCDTTTTTTTTTTINTNYTLKIGIIDYGIIGKLTREEQNIFFNFFKILVSRKYKKLAKYIVEHLSEQLDKGDKHNKLNENIDSLSKEQLINDVYNVCYNTLSVKQIFFGGKEIYQVNKILKTQNLTFSKFFCRIELAIAISENVCNTLCNDKTYIEQLMTAFKDLFSGNYDSIFDDDDDEDEDEVEDEVEDEICNNIEEYNN
jgi:predicted unusual protein kinase regulating ubiquinone biosynthesis (AarF/ABC1/UbiB family)